MAASRLTGWPALGWSTVPAARTLPYGAHTAEQIVYNLVVDDGVRDRGHRRNIMQTMFNQAGVSVGSHPVYGTMCVIDFAGNY